MKAVFGKKQNSQTLYTSEKDSGATDVDAQASLCVLDLSIVDLK